MNKKLTTAGAALSPANYISPAVKVTEILSEGLLCMSGIGSFLDLEDDEYVNW